MKRSSKMFALLFRQRSGYQDTSSHHGELARAFCSRIHTDILRYYSTVSDANVEAARSALDDMWHDLTNSSGQGQGYWVKVLKRMYALAAKADRDILEQEALEHLVEDPELDIFRYFAQRNHGSQHDCGDGR